MHAARGRKRIAMTPASTSFPVVREAVASFPDREHFHNAVTGLLAAGFETSDLSVLASHDLLAAAGEAVGDRPGIIPAGLSDEIKYIAPLTVAGIVLISGGPIAAIVAGICRRGSRWRRPERIFRRLHGTPAQRRFRRGAEGWRRPLMGALRGCRPRTDRDPNSRRDRRPACPYPRPPCQSALRRGMILPGKPVARHLLGGKAALRDSIGGFAIGGQILTRQLRRDRKLFGDYRIRLAA